MERMALFFILSVSLVKAEDFISEFEYGQMLYQNPRGVSCVPCHGDRGQGAEIVRYRERDGREVILTGPDIRRVSLAALAEKVKEGPGVMPGYFLTDEEIHAIYTYIREAEKRQKEMEE
ncbi:c-type cytochrome [Nitratifractor sp.]